MSDFDDIDFSASKAVESTENYPEVIDETNIVSEDFLVHNKVSIMPQIEPDLPYGGDEPKDNKIMDRVEKCFKFLFFAIIGGLGTLLLSVCSVLIPTMMLPVMVYAAFLVVYLPDAKYKFFTVIAGFLAWLVLVTLLNMLGTCIYEYFGSSTENGECTFFILNSL